MRDREVKLIEMEGARLIGQWYVWGLHTVLPDCRMRSQLAHPTASLAVQVDVTGKKCYK